MKALKRRLAASASLCLSVMAVAGVGAVRAQEPAGSNAEEEVVVTAQRRGQVIMDVPQPVQALTGRALESGGIKDLAQIVQMVPGSSIAAKISSATETYQIRSISAAETTGDATVGFYLDEFAFSIPGRPYAPSTNIYDLERVEVLRGPSGTLYGQGSLGGTIKVITKAPDLDSVSASVRASIGVSEKAALSSSADLMVNLPIISGELGIRGVLGYNRIGGYASVPALGLKNANAAETLSGRVKLLWKPSEKFDVTLAYWRNDTQQDFQNRLDSFDPPALNDLGYGNAPYDYSLYSSEIRYDLGFATLLSATGYVKQNINLFSVGRLSTLGDYTVNGPNETEGFVQDIRLTSNGDNFINYVAGAFYRDAQNAYSLDLDLRTAGFRQSGLQLTSSKTWAVYGEVSVNWLNGKLITTLGGRYSEEERTLDQNTQVLYYGPPQRIDGPFTNQVTGDGKTFNPHFNVTWKPSEDGMIYVDVAKGFRSGAVQPSSNINVLRNRLGIISANPLEPDTLWNYEIGLKWRFFDGDVNFEASLYSFDWTDAQLEYAPLGAGYIIQVGKVEGKGLDISATWRTPIEGLRVTFAGNINRTTLDGVLPSITTTAPWIRNGNQLPGTSKGTASVVLDYTTPIGDTGYDFFVNARYSHRGRQQSLSTLGKYAPELDIASLRAGFGNDNYDVTFFVENLTDEIGPSTYNGDRLTIVYPRQVGITFNARF
ncbi:Vitamin B12 transporter BtuB [Alphaproteobacteria bacterium SO-S41]|nr:Vitamin B12 transporter BtuB [Alphaproteobacteria bacterium SO-S41]